jgi:hypothetical protein
MHFYREVGKSKTEEFLFLTTQSNSINAELKMSNVEP